MFDLDQELCGVKSAAIIGHIRPDGDCIGSCMALYNYIAQYYPQIRADVYLQEFLPEYLMLKNADRVIHSAETEEAYDVCFSLDCADRQRHGEFVRYFDTAKKTIGIDHHISNQGFAGRHLIDSSAGATAELIYALIGKEKLTKEIAECLYLAIAHDTGVFQYSNATPKTFRIVADLLETGIDTAKIIDETFYQKTYAQNRILGKTLKESILLLGGSVIAGAVTLEDMEQYGVTAKDLDGIVSQLRYTKGTQVAVFLYELEKDRYKVSMRSNTKADVSIIAGQFGGGGHKKAAGCEITGSCSDVLNALTPLIAAQLEENEI